MAGFGDWFGDSGDTWFTAIQKFATQANQWLEDAFSASDVNESWWAAVVGTPSNPGMLNTWMVVLAPILVMMVFLQVALSVWRGSGLGVARAAAGAFLGAPATYVMVWFAEMASKASDEAAGFIIKQGGDQNASVFMRIFGIKVTDGKLTGLQENYFMWDGVMQKEGGWALLVPMLLMGAIWFLSIILAFVMSLRALGIIILASLAGWAVMSMSLEVTKSWFGSWMKIMVGLLMAKPLAAGLIVLSSTVFNYAQSGMQFAAGVAGLVLAIAMPFVAVQLVSFTAVGSIGGTDRALGQSFSAPARGITQGARGLSRLRRR